MDLMCISVLKLTNDDSKKTCESPWDFCSMCPSAKILQMNYLQIEIVENFRMAK